MGDIYLGHKVWLYYRKIFISRNSRTWLYSANDYYRRPHIHWKESSLGDSGCLCAVVLTLRLQGISVVIGDAGGWRKRELVVSIANGKHQLSDSCFGFG